MLILFLTFMFYYLKIYFTSLCNLCPDEVSLFCYFYPKGIVSGV
jgi:hypothetical protein